MEALRAGLQRRDLLSSFEKEYLLKLQEQSNTVMEVCFRTIPEAQKPSPGEVPQVDSVSLLFSILSPLYCVD